MMLRVLKHVVLAAALAAYVVTADQTVAECLEDNVECGFPHTCPTKCCTKGLQIRVDGLSRSCFTTGTLSPSPFLPSSNSGSGSNNATPTPASPSTAPASVPNGPKPAPPSKGPVAPAANVITPSPSNNNVDTYNTQSTVKSGSGGISATGAAVGVVGALAAVVGLVVAVIYKKRSPASSSSSSDDMAPDYKKGQTPDNRNSLDTLDGMLEQQVRGTTGSTHQLPVFSVADRSEVASALPSSPFSHRGARISSPKGSTAMVVDDMEFNDMEFNDLEYDAESTDVRSTSGSAVAVAFLDLEDGQHHNVQAQMPSSNTEVAL
ncbi:TPA: hypothetical protein N0F65_011904 [Lagenidium giganteum]|uniref:Uncharacterized protein n=1 Tax=Lagenidium giganteum TaxID=4803 RepID=A0AAV2YWP6_9STRA|nr:TPA: hypothetical protein N0F65_011904 [Lagenidium giganteum]